MTPTSDHRSIETLETLAGERRGAAKLAAVRRKDLAGLMELEQRLQSQKAAGSTPTKQEFDALVDDVHMIHRRLMAVMIELQKGLL